MKSTNSSIACPFFALLSYDRLSKKPLLFKSFTGLVVEEFDDIHNKKIAKKYDKHKIQRLSSTKGRMGSHLLVQEALQTGYQR
jgi:hypothetical protein